MSRISSIYKSNIPRREIGKPSTKKHQTIANDVPRQPGEPQSASERKFVRRAKQRGWDVLRAGWPDYLLVKKNGKGGLEFMAVEVKRDHKTDELRAAQKIMLASLAVQGMACYIWSAETSTLRKIERIDAQRTIDEYFNKIEGEKAKRGLLELRKLGVLVRYDV